MSTYYEEEDFLQLSGIQHFVFCRRQWALIHIEQLWAENLRTVEGDILHERAHDETITEKRADLLVSRGLRVFSRTLGITGACDIVEFQASPNGVSVVGQRGAWQPVPVEYKRGKPKEHDADELQLCAQAMCLEEMLVCSIPEGYLYYGEPKRRTKVILSKDLRQRVIDITAEMHGLFRRGYTPKVKPSASCKACSLVELCVPKLCNSTSVSAYIRTHLQEE